MNVINIVDDLNKINFGIWNAALSTVNDLQERFDVSSFLIAPRIDWRNADYKLAGIHYLDHFTTSAADEFLSLNPHLKPSNTIVETHGCWRFPTKLGCQFHKRGFKWVATPHGMLEPWSIAQHRLKKLVYFKLFEKPRLLKAFALRGVGLPETIRLGKLIGNSVLVENIPNGVSDLRHVIEENRRIRILFLGRLHHKKCVSELVSAFLKSKLRDNPKYELVVAGPDHGEESKIRDVLRVDHCDNITLKGPVYGDAKMELLKSSTYFALPSHSEGFPTSVLESMSQGCIPLISHGCNFPEAFQAGLAIQAEPSLLSIMTALNRLSEMDSNRLLEQRNLCVKFIASRFTTAAVSEMQYSLYQRLLQENR